METLKPAVIINKTLYVVVDSAMCGNIKLDSLVGPNGGVFTLWTYQNGRKELTNKSMRTIWSSK